LYEESTLQRNFPFSGSPLTQSDPTGEFGLAGAIGAGLSSAGTQFLACQILGGNVSTCLKCINLVDVAVSAVSTIYSMNSIFTNVDVISVVSQRFLADGA